MLAEAGPIDLLVANAGIALWEESWETDIDEWWHVLEVNVLGAYLTCRLALPGMIERGGGRIVITGSGASYLPGSTSGAYSASKAAVGRFGEVLANQVKDHERQGVRDQPRPRPDRDDRRGSPTTRRGRRPSWRRDSSASSPPAASTSSPAATSTPSTTRRTSSSGGSTGSWPRI